MDGATRTEARTDTALFAAYGRTRARTSRDELVARHRPLAEAMARRYVGRGIDADDLSQVAVVGLLKAIDRFDPDRGVAFSSFAVPTILGELRRHFRDRGWTVTVPRRLQELRMRAQRARETLAHELGREPTWSQIAAACDASTDEVVIALDAVRSAYLPESLDAGGPRACRTTEGLAEAATRQVLVSGLLAQLAERDRTVVQLRFWDGLTQQEIADRVGISQMHVSRVLRASLRRMRESLSAEAASV